MNNSKYGFDCWNNTDICTFNPTCEETEEPSYVQKYNLFDLTIFVNSQILKEKIENKHYRNLADIDENVPFKDAKILI